MNKIYYFSKSKLQLVEIKKQKLWFLLFAIFLVFLSAGLTLLGYSLFNSGSREFFVSSDKENAQLNNRLNEMASRYEDLNQQVDSLIKQNNDLRIAANLEPTSEDEQLLGTGGGEFDNVLDFLNANSQDALNYSYSLVEKIERKLEYQKQNYENISSVLVKNKELYDHLPAIIPAVGRYKVNDFGMRLHPILRYTRMHNGIDIVNAYGTPVFAPGAGTVDFSGWKGGYGLCIEIDHGFGYRTLYGHLSKSHVSVGQVVVRGQNIANIGSTGLSTGPHLHYEVSHNGVNLNPTHFFFDDYKYFSVPDSTTVVR